MATTELFMTADGTHTILIPEAGITYHSKFGAFRESRHIFIEAGLNYMAEKKSVIGIFEMGFGTGLNALLTMLEAEDKKLEISYVAVDTLVLDPQLIEQLNYSEILQAPMVRQKWKALHNTIIGEPHHLSTEFSFTRHDIPLQAFTTSQKFDVIYFDAFAPNFQPELWTVEIFEKVKAMMNPEACLLTYCSKGDVRRAMKQAGLTVTKLAGPPGKREMVRAINNV